MKRQRHIPEGYARVDTGDADVAVYAQDRTDGGGKMTFYAMGFIGKATNPTFYYRFRSDKSRQLHIDNFIACRKAHAQTMARRKSERKQPHSLNVGDVLHTNWGYEQTNVEFFQVTRVLGPHTVELREIAQARATDEMGMRGRCAPLADHFLSPRWEGDDQGVSIVRRASADGTVRIDSVRRAWPHDGRESYHWSSDH